MVEINREFVELFRGADNPYAIIGVGLPGIGKSEQLQGLAEELGAGYVSKIVANRKLRHLNDRRVGRRPLTSNDLFVMMTRKIIEDKGAVVVDSHHSTEELRQSTRDVVMRKGVQAVAAIYFEAGLDYALARRLEGQTGASERIIELIDFNLRSDPVSYREGFDLILDHGIPEGPSVIRDN